MLPLPHRYVVTAIPAAAGAVRLTTPGVPPLATGAPAEFDGAGDAWSPETLLVGAAADCFALTFRGVARTSQLEWTEMSCEATGTLDRVDGVMRFIRLDLYAHLTLPEGVNAALAGRVLDKAKRSCLITSSLNAEVHLSTAIVTVPSGHGRAAGCLPRTHASLDAAAGLRGSPSSARIVLADDAGRRT